MLLLGQFNDLKVLKETDIAYTLTDGENEVFLHFNQTQDKLKIGDTVRVFLYFDQKKRLCATTEDAKITIDHYDFVEVVGISSAGLFMNIGISKDLLLSSDDLPSNTRLWPRLNDRLPCLVKVKKNQLTAKIISFNDLSENELVINQEYNGIVCNISKNNQGITVITDDFKMAYIHNNLLRKNYHLGEEITFKVKDFKNNIYYATTLENKEIELIKDSEIIMNYLNTFGGMMPLGNASTPDEIFKLLHMSKSAFKRAMGHLYKERLIEIFDKKTILNKRTNN